MRMDFCKCCPTVRFERAFRPLLMAGISLAVAGLAGPVTGETTVNLVRHGGFEGDDAAVQADGWRLTPGASIMRDGAGAYAGTGFLCCTNPGEAGKPSGAEQTRLTVKPHTGYRLRARVQYDGGGHLTLAVKNVDGTYLACRDRYGWAKGWHVLELPFRTETQREIRVWAGRRYGTGAVHYDDVELIEDDTVRIGDCSPAPNPFPKTTAAEEATGCLFSVQPWLQAVYPSYAPTRTEINQPLVCRLAPGEFEPMTLSVTALRALKGVQASLAGDLEGPAGNRIAATNVTIGVVRNLTRWLTNRAPLEPGQRFERTPTFIYPNQPFDVPARETVRLWLTVQADARQAPGVYRGAIETAWPGGGSWRVPIEVEVLPIRLSRATPVYGTYFSPHHLKHLPASNRTEAAVMRAWADMKAHGMNSASIYAKLERRQPDKTWRIDLERPGETDSLPAQMRQLQASGMLEEARPQMLLPGEAGSQGKIFNEERVVQAVETLRREHGWPELLWYLVDEPGSAKRIALAKTLTAIVHRVPGVRTTTATIRNELYDSYDVFIPGIPGQMTALEEIVRRAEADGKEVWSYNCTWNGNHPINDRYYSGLYMWTSGLRGNWQWCFAGRGYREGSGAGGLPRLTDELDLGAIANMEDPWYATYTLATPTHFIPTPGWEARREGIDDFRYLQTLAEAVATVNQNGSDERAAAARAAERFLAEVKTRSNPPAQIVPRSNSGQNWHTLHPGLTAVDYDAIRRQAIDHILALH